MGHADLLCVVENNDFFMLSRVLQAGNQICFCTASQTKFLERRMVEKNRARIKMLDELLGTRRSAITEMLTSAASCGCSVISLHYTEEQSQNVNFVMICF